MHFLAVLQAIGAHSMAAANIWSENNSSRSCLALVGSRSFSPPPARGCLSTRLYRRIHPRMFASSPPTYVVLCRLFFYLKRKWKFAKYISRKGGNQRNFRKNPGGGANTKFQKTSPCSFSFSQLFRTRETLLSPRTVPASACSNSPRSGLTSSPSPSARPG